jgi:hypothetical protein
MARTSLSGIRLEIIEKAVIWSRSSLTPCLHITTYLGISLLYQASYVGSSLEPWTHLHRRCSWQISWASPSTL